MTSLDKSSVEYQQELRRQYRKREAFERQIDKIISGGSQSGDDDDGFYNDGEMMWPVPYKNSYISAGYGYYDPEGDGTYTMHPAIDIVVRENGVNVSYGKKIVAAQSGKVLVRGYSDVGGNYITIDHGDGYRTYYGHCSKIVASAGQYVEKARSSPIWATPDMSPDRMSISRSCMSRTVPSQGSILSILSRLRIDLRQEGT